MQMSKQNTHDTYLNDINRKEKHFLFKWATI